ncbi:MAG: FAD-binding oxidoreductase [Betaproteobacteria bacterium]|nr:FAD-binding oxidoreductase [Betaproteobacteria bacterium]
MTQATTAVRKTVIPFRSAILATAPLDPDLLATVMRTGRSYSETRRMMRWFRPWGSRMLFGGRGAFGREDTKAAFDALETAMKKTFPQLEAVRITHRWSGLVSMTLNSLPQVGKLDRHTGFALGYNGAGIAMSSLMGRRVVDLARRHAGIGPYAGVIDQRKFRFLFSVHQPSVWLLVLYQFLDRVGL